MINFLILAFVVSVIIALVGWRANRLTVKMKKAEQAFEIEDFQTANAIVREILETHKDNVPAKYLKAKLLMRQTQYIQAIFELNSILAIENYKNHANELDIRTNLALLYHETKNYEKEVKEYKAVAAIDPDNVIANEKLGHAMFTKKNYQAALGYLLKVNELSKNHNCSTAIGICYYMLNNFESAEDFLLHSLRENDDNDEARYYLGSINCMRRTYTEAVPFLELAKRHQKYFLKSTYLLGLIYYEKDNYEQAIATLESGLKSLKDRTDEAAEYRYLLANAYEIEGKIKEATYHWDKISNDTPEFKDVKDKLDSYRTIMSNPHLIELFSTTIEDNQPLIKEIIALLQYNVVSSTKISANEYQYKALNIKRPNEPPSLVTYFKTTKELNENYMNDFQRKITSNKCKSGIFITTGSFSPRVKLNIDSKKEINLIDADELSKLIERANLKIVKG